MSCIFCDIIAEKSPATVVHRDDEFIAFRDIRPAAENHLLVVPREHVPNVTSVTDVSVIQRMKSFGRASLNELGVKDDVDVKYGFHWPPFNQINHLHLHVIHPASSMRWLARWIFWDCYWFRSPERVVEWLNEKLKPNE